MKKQIVIIGAGGHGRVVADIARLLGYQDIGFLDDQPVAGVRQLGSVSDFEKYIHSADFFVAVGNNRIRQMLFEKLEHSGANIVNLLHPNAVIAADVTVGRGVAVMAGAVINTGSHIADGAIINTCASADHDCNVGAFSHISVGGHLAGTVTVGARTFVGAGAVVINNLSVCEDCMIGAGAVVIRSVDVPGTYVGCPARKMD